MLFGGVIEERLVVGIRSDSNGGGRVRLHRIQELLQAFL
jgi:hypothetical protein